MAKGLILVVDDDEWVARLLADALADADFATLVCDNAEAGVEIAHAHGPACVVADLHLPDHDGHWPARELRRLPGPAALVPVLFLSSQDDEGTRIEAHRAGGDVLMSKPFRIDEVLAQIEALGAMQERLQARAAAPLRGASEPQIQGELEVFPVTTLLTLIDQSALTGILEVQGKKRKVTLELVDGQPVGGSLGGHQADVLRVLRELIGWSLGRFVFRKARVPRPAKLASLARLLLEAARLEDEARHKLETSLQVSGFVAPTLGGPATTPEDYAPPSSRSPARLVAEHRVKAPIARMGLRLSPKVSPPSRSGRG